MSRHIVHRSARHVAAVLVALVVLLGFGAPSSAGGWAVGSLDAVPEATAGQTVEVGFTILQHGVTPADLAEDVGIEIVRSDGSVDFFAGASDGVLGHYVAKVRFPATDGEYTWGVRMGWFGTQDLGTIEVLPSDRSPAGSGPSAWSAARWVMVIATVALATIAVTDLVATRRRIRPIPS